jgi:predicted RNA-binding protein with TRAM domain
MPLPEPPVKVGEKYDVKIDASVSSDEGLTRIKGFLVFVKGVKAGEEIKIEITDISNRFAYGKKV